VERLSERILFIKGELKLAPAGPVKEIKDVAQMLKCARSMEESSVRDYNNWANQCSAAADSISKQLFESLTADEERHYDQYDTEFENLEKFGPQYLALQSIERSKARAAAALPAAGA
jgi:bacterioferritin